MITATTWMLLFNAIVAFQWFEDGKPRSIVPMLSVATILFVITGYVTLDTGFGWTGHFSASYDPPNKNLGLYFLYQFIPLLFLVAYYVLEAVVALKVLGEVKPMIYLTVAAVLFAIGQVCNYVISPYICRGTTGKVDGAFLETLFTLLSVVMVWAFWHLITDDEFPALPQSSAPVHYPAQSYPSPPLPETVQRFSSESQREREAMMEIRKSYIEIVGNQVQAQRSSSSYLNASGEELWNRIRESVVMRPARVLTPQEMEEARRERDEVAGRWLAENPGFIQSLGPRA